MRASKTARKKHALEERLGAVIMALLLLITLTNVVARYVTSQSLAWTEEFSVFLLVALALAGTAAVAAQDAHIRIEFFYAGGSAVRRRLLAWLTTVATVLLFALLAVLLARTGWQEFQFEETSTGLGLPRWWYTGILSVLAVPVALRAIGAHWSKSRGAGTAKASQEAEL
ncbi:MAG: TRAP transporter small permease subunit [Burkholderiaceae bacterium]|jgi:TRAP-type C4-dicarboxylate transport system permease small subunit|nr:TRAP transporter small permease subunit [Burkholderiaceae bacterium]